MHYLKQHRDILFTSILTILFFVPIYFLNDKAGSFQSDKIIINYGLGNFKISLAYNESYIFIVLGLISLIPSVILYLKEHYTADAYSKSFIAICIHMAINASLLVGIALSANLFTIFIFYELLTLATIPLILSGTDPKKKSALKYYIKFLVTFSILLLLPLVIIIGNQNFSEAGFITQYFSIKQSIIILCIFLFAFSKAAVVPVHSWIIKAMVAPYPVSGLIHGVVVVKAGIICILKICYGIYGVDYFQNLCKSQYLLIFIPIVSVIYSSIQANLQNNIKRILAYSTISQLSIIIFITMTSSFFNVELAIFNHAINKLMLFLAFGSLYRYFDVKNISDLEKIYKSSPFIIIYIILASLCIAGIPISAGAAVKRQLFKDLPLEINSLVFIFQMLTISYLYRMVSSCFGSLEINHGRNNNIKSLHFFAAIFLIVNIYLSIEEYQNIYSILHDYAKFVISFIGGVTISKLITFIKKLMIHHKITFSKNIFVLHSTRNNLLTLHIDYQIIIIIAGLILFLYI